MRILSLVPCETRSSSETEPVTKVSIPAAKGYFIPIRWASTSATSNGASPTDSARITKRTDTVTTASLSMASIPGMESTSRDREPYV